MTRFAYLDTETYSDTPIRNGTFRYAEDSEVLLFAYALEDEDPAVWDLTAKEPMPAKLKYIFETPDVICIFHNYLFDTSVLEYALDIQIPSTRLWCTMAQALAHSLPGALGTLCAVMGVKLEDAKSAKGHDLVRMFCMPRPANTKIRRLTCDTNPAEWEEFKRYAASDIKAMRAIHHKMPRWNYSGSEMELWRLDRRIAKKGMRVDRSLARSAIDAVAKAQGELGRDVSRRSAGVVGAATQRDKLLKFILEEHGVALPDLQKSTIERRLNDESLPQEVKELLAIRLEASMSSTSKYAALMKAVNDDGRLRGTLQFCGASRTGRDAGRTFQPQNLMRPTMSATQIEQGIEIIKSGAAHFILPNVIEMAANAVRGCIIAPEGKKLVVSDLSNIEGRFAAWVADEQWKLKAFADFDEEKGADLYKLAYAKAFGMDVKDVTKDQRAVGKIMELACVTGDTKILTNHGIKAILDLCSEDLVWDGIKWVKHKGLVAKGVRKIVNVAGIQLTPDHLVLTGKIWKPAKQLVSNENNLSRALATGSMNLPLSDSTTVMQAALSLLKFNVLAGRTRTMFFSIISIKKQVLVAVNALRNKEVFGGKNTMGMRILSPIKITEHVYSDESPPASIDVITQKTEATPITEAVGYGCAPLGEKIENLSYDILWISKGGMRRISNSTEKMLIKGTNPGIYDLLQKLKTIATVAKSLPCKKELIIWKPVYDIVNAGPRNRFTVISNKGPLIIHNCGYEGGVGAYVTMSAAYNMNLDVMAAAALPSIPERIKLEALRAHEWTLKQKRPTFELSPQTYIAIDCLKRMWREAHPQISSIWKELKEAFTNAIHTPKKDFKVRKLILRKDGNWLRIILPSGRSLCYPSPKVDETGQLSYMGVSPYSRKWERIQTYSGKLFENSVQAGARDIFMSSLQPAWDAGYECVMRIHDELICEAPDTAEFTAEELSTLMATNPSWAAGLPLAAGGFEAKRYRKGD